MSLAILVIVSGTAHRSSISCPIAFVNLSLPLVSCVRAGGEWRAIDRLASPSRVPRQESVKNEAPPATVGIPRKTLEASTFGVLGLLDASRTKAALGGRAGGAKRHCLLLQSEGAIDQSLGTSLRSSAWPTEVRPTQVAEPKTAESTDRFCDFADWRPASFHFTDSSLLEVEETELERASQVLDPHCTRHAAASRTQTSRLSGPSHLPRRPPACCLCLLSKPPSPVPPRWTPANPPRRTGAQCSSPGRQRPRWRRGTTRPS